MSNASTSNASAMNTDSPATADLECDTGSILISIPSSAEYVRVVRMALLGVASRMEFSYDDVEDLKLATAEACNNAILHSRAGGKVHIALKPCADRLEIDVTDGGRVAEPGIVPPRTRPAEKDEELRESGLGLFLMQALMDKVEHITGPDSDTRVRLVKYLPNVRHRRNGTL